MHYPAAGTPCLGFKDSIRDRAILVLHGAEVEFVCWKFVGVLSESVLLSVNAAIIQTVPWLGVSTDHNGELCAFAAKLRGQPNYACVFQRAVSRNQVQHSLKTDTRTFKKRSIPSI